MGREDAGIATTTKRKYPRRAIIPRLNRRQADAAGFDGTNEQTVRWTGGPQRCTGRRRHRNDEENKRKYTLVIFFMFYHFNFKVLTSSSPGFALLSLL
jgi:hypothetical protein